MSAGSVRFLKSIRVLLFETLAFAPFRGYLVYHGRMEEANRPVATEVAAARNGQIIYLLRGIASSFGYICSLSNEVQYTKGKYSNP